MESVQLSQGNFSTATKGGAYTRFRMAYDLRGTFNLQSMAKKLPEGAVVCTPDLIAGTDHIEAILNQAEELWRRGESLARNKSIDLLMRITCQEQIADAVAASGISEAKTIALFGLVPEESQIQKSIEIIRTVAKDLERNDELFLLSKKKRDYLKKFHKLPRWFNEDQILTALKEKSVLLVFSK